MRLIPAAAILVWLAVMAFFAFGVAPAAFSSLEREAAGRFVSAVFPRYYAVGTALGLSALLAAVMRGLGTGRSVGEWIGLGLLALMLALTLYSWLVVLPGAHAAREAMRQAGAAAGAASSEALAFARLHRLSGILNATVMGAGVLFLILEEVRRR
ncbi:MAG TPA: DUF4149 domain-containing protein [Methylomirabilota bacterium]|nr:DUF4149 domain-containing protein [Methylomirabilota bacterium]